MKKYLFLLVTLLAGGMLFSSCADEEITPDPEKVENPIPPAPPADLVVEFDVNYLSELKNTIYPSLIYGFSEFEKQQQTLPWFVVSLSTNVQADLRIVVEASKLNAETIIPVKALEGKKELAAAIKWKWDEMKFLSQPGNVDMTFVCYDANSKEVGRKDIKMSYRAINECVFRLFVNGKKLYLDWMFAAYVNEDSPVIDSFLSLVLQNTTLSGFSGYQEGEEKVKEQVKACFETLRGMGVAYSNITTTSNSDNPNVVSQYIRFADEVLENTQANCVDGTVFFCSVLRKIGINPLLVLTPDHAYVAYALDAEETTFAFLETTAVGSATFQDASDVAELQYLENKDKFADKENKDWVVISVDGCRKIIKPIGR